MSQITDLLLQERYPELWQLCCGFLDLNLEQFMKIQEQLLLEQLTSLQKCKMGRKLLHGAVPKTVAEFREQVPLTTYPDYCSDLLQKCEDDLPVKPITWVQTSGRSGEYACKWVPVSRQFWDEAGIDFAAIAIFGACSGKEKFTIKNNMRLLYAAALTPCLTGNIAKKLQDDVGFAFLPSLDEINSMSFEERVENGFNLALSGGMDGFFGLGGVLVGIGEKIKNGSGKLNPVHLLKQPRVAIRFARGFVKAKKEKRHILPKDLWDLKVIVSMGTDSLVYQERIKELWGRTPLNVYGNSETAVIATQTWDYRDMVFFPNLNFLEFIPAEECLKSRQNPFYQPKTMLLNEVREQETYELVITNFHGGIMTRYRLGELIRIAALRNAALGINLPQMVFEQRADDLIDLGFMRLTERVIGQALENARIPYHGWMAHKEIAVNPRLRLYLEMQPGYAASVKELAHTIYEEIKQMDDGLYVYKDLASLENLIDFSPIEITLLDAGTFSNYKKIKTGQGADLTELKPPHINPSEEILAQLGIDVARAAEAAGHKDMVSN
ncbi:MAG: GH3 auxin-responsive promoter family protein [Dehalococcoidales bacterium]